MYQNSIRPVFKLIDSTLSLVIECPLVGVWKSVKVVCMEYTELLVIDKEDFDELKLDR